MPENSTSQWVRYQNGNYTVSLDLITGTKIRETPADEFIASRPESMDVKISNMCHRGCPFCHEDSRPDGKIADLEFASLIASSCQPYTEIAVGGGNLMENPEHTEKFLRILRSQDCVPSITIRQDDFLANLPLIARWRQESLVFGIGVSLSDSSDPGLVPALLSFPTAVLHTIVGIIDEEDFENLSDKGVKVLLLGYKDIRRGHEFLDEEHDAIVANTRWLSDNLASFMQGFKICSFDNLALEQLPVREVVGEETWEQFYMGDDGTATFYIDLVEKQFAESSTSLDRHDIMVFNEYGEKFGFWPVDQMFAQVRNAHEERTRLEGE